MVDPPTAELDGTRDWVGHGYVLVIVATIPGSALARMAWPTWRPAKAKTVCSALGNRTLPWTVVTPARVAIWTASRPVPKWLVLRRMAATATRKARRSTYMAMVLMNHGMPEMTGNGIKFTEIAMELRERWWDHPSWEWSVTIFTKNSAGSLRKNVGDLPPTPSFASRRQRR